MTARTAPPLPECIGCGTPTRRATYWANGRRCTPCHAALEATRPSQLSLAGTDALEHDRG